MCSRVFVCLVSCKLENFELTTPNVYHPISIHFTFHGGSESNFSTSHTKYRELILNMQRILHISFHFVSFGNRNGFFLFFLSFSIWDPTTFAGLLCSYKLFLNFHFGCCVWLQFYQTSILLNYYDIECKTLSTLIYRKFDNVPQNKQTKWNGCKDAQMCFQLCETNLLSNIVYIFCHHVSQFSFWTSSFRNERVDCGTRK